MDNASLFYEEIKSYDDIQELIGTQEDFFIDFKETASRTGSMTEDDKANFSKAASGFAHQQGGVLIWGISTKKDNNDESRATELKPIVQVRAFCSALRGFIRNSTDPPVDGIQHRIIYERDDEESDIGFVVSFFPKSYGVHRSLHGRTKNAFYKRYGDGFHSLTTDEIKALFSRSLSPDLDLRVTRDQNNTLRFFLENKGKGIAKNCAVYIGIKGGHISWYDGEGNIKFKISQPLRVVDPVQREEYNRQIKLRSGIVIFPTEQICVATATCSQPCPTKVRYRIFSENMVPKEGVTEPELVTA